MIGLLIVMLVAAPTQVTSIPDVTSSLVDLFRVSDEYRQCLVLDKGLAAQPRDTYFAEGGTSAENLDLMLADGQDRLLKHLVEHGKSDVIINAIQKVHYTQVNEETCRDFDPYYSPALEKLVDLEKMVGLEVRAKQKRWRPQRSR